MSKNESGSDHPRSAETPETPETPETVLLDAELLALAVAYDALRDHRREAQCRMLTWLSERLTADFYAQPVFREPNKNV